MPDEMKPGAASDQRPETDDDGRVAADVAEVETPPGTDDQNLGDAEGADVNRDVPAGTGEPFTEDDKPTPAGPDRAGDTILGRESRQDLEDEFPDLSSVRMDESMANPAEFQQLSPASGGARPGQNIDLLLDVKMPIAIELGRTEMPISEILALGPGSVVELDKLAGEPVDLLVNGKIVARGEVVVVDENFGVRITMLMSPQERLKSLAQ